VYLPLSISSLCALIRKRARVDRFDNSFILSEYFSCWNINLNSVENRICEAVEDEEHLLIKCNKYSFARNTFFSNINNNFFPELSDRNKFIWLLSNEDREICKNLYKHESALLPVLVIEHKYTYLINPLLKGKLL
jgi:hypothetical protein